MQRKNAEKAKNANIVIFSLSYVLYQLLKYVGSIVAKKRQFKIFGKMVHVSFGFEDTAVDEPK